MPKRLKNLILNRVDLVDKGDNPEAHIQLFKRKEEKDEEDISGMQLFADAAGVEKLFTLFKNLFQKEGVKENMPFNIKKFLDGLDKDVKTPLEERLSKLSTERVETIEKNMAELEEELHSALILTYELDKQEREVEIETLKAEEEEEEENDTDKEEDEDEDEDMDKVLKGLPKSVRKLVEASMKDAEAATKLVKKMEEETLIQKYITKATQYPTVVTSPDKLGPVLKKVADISKEDCAYIEAILKTAEEMIVRNNTILKQIGSDGDQGVGTAWGEIEEKAKNMVKADPSMTQAQAIKRVMKEEPQLYKRYQQELQEEV